MITFIVVGNLLFLFIRSIRHDTLYMRMDGSSIPDMKQDWMGCEQNNTPREYFTIILSFIGTNLVILNSSETATSSEESVSIIEVQLWMQSFQLGFYFFNIAFPLDCRWCVRSKDNRKRAAKWGQFLAAGLAFVVIPILSIFYYAYELFYTGDAIDNANFFRAWILMHPLNGIFFILIFIKLHKFDNFFGQTWKALFYPTWEKYRIIDTLDYFDKDAYKVTKKNICTQVAIYEIRPKFKLLNDIIDDLKKTHDIEGKKSEETFEDSKYDLFKTLDEIGGKESNEPLQNAMDEHWEKLTEATSVAGKPWMEWKLHYNFTDFRNQEWYKDLSREQQLLLRRLILEQKSHGDGKLPDLLLNDIRLPPQLSDEMRNDRKEWWQNVQMKVEEKLSEVRVRSIRADGNSKSKEFPKELIAELKRRPGRCNYFSSKGKHEKSKN